MITFLATGTLLGLSAGFAPGPLLALVISETLQHGLRSGLKVSLAPVITDLPIIIVTYFILSSLADSHWILGFISMGGGFFVLYLGWESFRTTGVDTQLMKLKPNSLQKGIMVNALSPHPYLFWLSVGGPLIKKAADHGVFAVLAFVVSFYGLLVGSKIVLAILVGKSRRFLAGKTYIVIMRLLGFLLFGFGGFLIYDGFHLAGVL